MSAVTYAHIEPDEQGRPIVSGTRFKVRLIAQDHVAHGRDAEEIRRHHPGLTLGQIHSALAYYYDHKDEMDRDLEERHRRVDRLRAESASEESPGRRRLRERGLIP
ncbi:DUF433 domain-containing protein [Tautonia plasticadhaerens]|uniref:DUF433 domain-containing protein n=1 Tax=Tautonia plasticadhaerens TaxID=2527974 RepID=A0A518HBY8_9BACT|nr:DUF433 domain-containing protein [Tautonia plasticadhaerens]QDV38378.1 hypothetical protein ElP_63330 [Tautonia plasticadhaerens]